MHRSAVAAYALGALAVMFAMSASPAQTPVCVATGHCSSGGASACCSRCAAISEECGGGEMCVAAIRCYRSETPRSDRWQVGSIADHATKGVMAARRDVLRPSAGASVLRTHDPGR